MKILIILFSIFLFTTQVLNNKISHKCNIVQRTQTLHVLNSTTTLQKRNSVKRSDTSQNEEDTFSIKLVPKNGMRTYPQAHECFLLAAKIWSQIFHNTQTRNIITIDVDMRALHANILGSTQGVNILSDCESPSGILPDPLSIRSGIRFPLCGDIKYDLPDSVSYPGKMNYPKAYLKAIDIDGLDEMFGRSDAEIAFSSRYARDFDFDFSDGFDTSKMSFLSVTMHEIGHVLGFVSGIDEIDYGETVFYHRPLDLFRFGSAKSGPPDFLGENRVANPRIEGHMFFTPGLGRDENRDGPHFSRGTFSGDGNQASHWKADEITGTHLGIMDPTLGTGVHVPVSLNDVFVFNALGYSVDVSLDPIVLFSKLENSRGRNYLMISAEYVFFNNLSVKYSNSETPLKCDFDRLRFLWRCPYSVNGECDFRLVTRNGHVGNVTRIYTPHCRQ